MFCWKEFYFADWRFFVFCGNKFLRFSVQAAEHWQGRKLNIFNWILLNLRRWYITALKDWRNNKIKQKAYPCPLPCSTKKLLLLHATTGIIINVNSSCLRPISPQQRKFTLKSRVLYWTEGSTFLRRFILREFFSAVIYFCRDRGQSAKSAKVKTRKIFMLHGIYITLSHLLSSHLAFS